MLRKYAKILKFKFYSLNVIKLRKTSATFKKKINFLNV